MQSCDVKSDTRQELTAKFTFTDHSDVEQSPTSLLARDVQWSPNGDYTIAVNSGSGKRAQIAVLRSEGPRRRPRWERRRGWTRYRSSLYVRSASLREHYDGVLSRRTPRRAAHRLQSGEQVARLVEHFHLRALDAALRTASVVCDCCFERRL